MDFKNMMFSGYPQVSNHLTILNLISCITENSFNDIIEEDFVWEIFHQKPLIAINKNYKCVLYHLTDFEYNRSSFY